MGNCHLYKIECFHTLGTTESERPKVTVLPSPKRLRAGRSKSFPPDRLSPFSKSRFFHIMTQSLKGEESREARDDYPPLQPACAKPLRRRQGGGSGGGG